MRAFIAIFTGIAVPLCAGCTTVSFVPGVGETRELISVGITRIVIPERKGDLIAFRRTGLGLGIGGNTAAAAWLGFDQSEWIIADPASCQLVVIIRSDVEAENAARILESVRGEDICYTKDARR